MRIAAVSDTHGMLGQAELPEADVLVVAGDYCPDLVSDEVACARRQLEWIERELSPFLRGLPYQRVILIAGNHDWVHFVPETAPAARRALAPTVYLQDEATEVEGVRFYGSPWQPWFYDWAFNFDREDSERGHAQARRTWAAIPPDVDVLVTHGPPWDVLDLAPGERHVGCPALGARVREVQPKLHVFGHIHGSYGTEERDSTRFANVALCDEGYRPVHPVQVFEV